MEVTAVPCDREFHINLMVMHFYADVVLIAVLLTGYWVFSWSEALKN